MIKYAYITAPFWHRDHDIRHLRYSCVTQAAGKLIETGESIFSPITHSYMFKLKGNLDKWSHDDMLSFDKAILENASKIYILTLPGWKESKGINMELIFAAGCNPICTAIFCKLIMINNIRSEIGYFANAVEKNIAITRDKMINNIRSEIGYFANAVDNIAITTDGVGTKALIASMMGVYDTIGIDCVAMNVNDLIAYGATPKVMVDYIILPQDDPTILKSIHYGLNIGAKNANIDIIGGETAILNFFDLSGTAVGYVDTPLIGENIKSGDLIIGLSSNGIHCNGIKRAWDVFASNGYGLTSYIQDFGCTLSEELLKPTKIYSSDIISFDCIKAIINITGGGFNNIGRVKKKIKWEIFEKELSIKHFPIFNMLSTLSNMKIKEMYKYWNLGYGMCLIVDPKYNEIGTVIGKIL